MFGLVTKAKKTKAHAERNILKKAVLFTLFIFLLVLADNYANIFTSWQESYGSTNKWQAVFLVNGQVYFGKLSRHGFHNFRLDSVYYPQQIKEQPKETSLGEENIPETELQTRTVLLSITQELHQPENTIYIPKKSILYWENLTNNSPVVQRIISTQ